ncbi:MAG: fibronectin type III domain-containing protein [Anaerolineae bacterium]
MKVRSLLVPFMLCVLAALVALPVHSQGGIVVDGADTVRQESISLDPGLGSVTSSVGPRVLMANANTQRQVPLTGPTSALQGVFSQVQPRIVFLTANTNRHAGLSTPPTALQSLFSAVQPRVIIQAAKTNRSNTLSYPVALIGDTTQPQISAIAASRQGSTATVSWTTNEFADSTVLYGTQSGNLTQTVSDPLYVKQHEMALSGLASGVAYYYRVRSVDRSGNVALSQERVLQGQSLLFVPLIRRSN